MLTKYIAAMSMKLVKLLPEGTDKFQVLITETKGRCTDYCRSLLEKKKRKILTKDWIMVTDYRFWNKKTIIGKQFSAG